MTNNTIKRVTVKSLSIGDTVNLGLPYVLEKKKLDKATGLWNLKLTSGIYTAKRVFAGKTEVIVHV